MDEVYGKHITLSREEEAVVTVGNYSAGVTNVLASYPVRGEQAEIVKAQDKAVWDYLCGFCWCRPGRKLRSLTSLPTALATFWPTPLPCRKMA